MQDYIYHQIHNNFDSLSTLHLDPIYIYTFAFDNVANQWTVEITVIITRWKASLLEKVSDIYNKLPE
jgi:hypothetical protein